MRCNALVLALVAGFFCNLNANSETGDYKSPYQVVFSIPVEQLLAPDSEPPRNSKEKESLTPYDDWYSPRIRRKFGVWGPEPRHYPAITDFDQLSPDWKRQRLVAVATEWIGLPYQHHHVPDWDPPEDWPWKPVKYGRNSKGVDCSDFTSWVYNYGLGIKLKTAIRVQAEDNTVPSPGGDGFIEAQTIENDSGYEGLVKRLKTGDLLYIKNKEGVVSHVIMWVGDCGKAPDGAPLVIDSTGMGHTDSNGTDIPIGVHLRPFLPDAWYYKSFSHAHRIIADSN